MHIWATSARGAGTTEFARMSGITHTGCARGWTSKREAPAWGSRFVTTRSTRLGLGLGLGLANLNPTPNPAPTPTPLLLLPDPNPNEVNTGVMVIEPFNRCEVVCSL